MKILNNFLFTASFLIASAIVIALSGCSHRDQEKKEAPAPAPASKPAPIPPPKESFSRIAPVSVDFDNAPLSEVALFVTGQTGKGFVLNSTASTPLSWIEYAIPHDKVFDSFARALGNSGLILKQTSDDGKTYTIDKPEDIKVPYKLNFATSSRGTFFLLGSTIYSKEQFPFPIQQDGGHWYAMVPKSYVDALTVK
ncbi:MAG: hypothetical protein LBD10_04605 [Desulfobulbus sp.]|jgi:hypothetical protein|uniref:hypothetical protein n=1 Tax=Desulfobulbus sp. TaxID=895 RepID=UPI00283DACE6|nr:hypothetical protein [Desulfobulbus sp.]MDR2549466.1 hypothetical protein [Desulfobulbus sp.]